MSHINLAESGRGLSLYGHDLSVVDTVVSTPTTTIELIATVFNKNPGKKASVMRRSVVGLCELINTFSLCEVLSLYVKKC